MNMLCIVLLRGPLTECDDKASCYLHVLAEISSRRLAHADDDANVEKRQLESSSVHHTLLTVPITVEEPAGGDLDSQRFRRGVVGRGMVTNNPPKKTQKDLQKGDT